MEALRAEWDTARSPLEGELAAHAAAADARRGGGETHGCAAWGLEFIVKGSGFEVYGKGCIGVHD
jgi:hypothetical protein